LEKVEDLLADAVTKGAKILAGGKRLEGQGNGFFFQPTIITNLTPEMTIWTEEVS
jgi:succinate-semialdehyde dehydrogenase/glutarate-semialdehyde dehydrogenase